MKLKYLAVLTLLSLAFAPSKSDALDLGELAFFGRCYAHLTGRALPLNHPLRAGLRNGSVDALTACKALFAKGQLDSTTHEVNKTDPEAMLVFQNIYSLHRTWFNAIDYVQMQGFWADGTYDVWDANTPAIMLNNILFAKGADTKQYRSIFKDTSGYLGIRTLDTVENARFRGGVWHNYPTRIFDFGSPTYGVAQLSEKTTMSYGGPGASITVPFTGITVGELTGVKVDDRSTTISNYAPGILWKDISVYSGTAKVENALQTAGMIPSFDIFQREGGGILGDPAFMLINWGHPTGVRMDGALKMPRRLVKNAMEALLCKEFPVLRETDVLSYVDVSGGATVAPFRKSSTCVQCHATFDQIGSVYRNHLVSFSDWNTGNPGHDPQDGAGFAIKVVHLMGRFNGALPDSGVWSSTPVTNYEKQAPAGRVYFREFSGNLVNQPVNGIQQVGDTLAESNDLYLCAAKRYFQYFTGFNVKLYDRGDPRFLTTVQSLTQQERSLRQYLEKLATNFKNDQSSYNLIQSIISSPYYRDLNYSPGVQ
jgi:hypothetical protein